MIENIDGENNKNNLKHSFFIWPIFQIAVFGYFGGLIFEEIQVGTFHPIFLFTLFFSHIFLIIGSVFRYKNSNKSKYLIGISFLSGMVSLYFWHSFIAISCVIPAIIAISMQYSKLTNNKFAEFFIFVFGCAGLALSINSIYSEQNHATEKVKEILIDSQSAIFRNVRAPQSYKKVVCGEVNAKNRMGGYTGFQKFISIDRTPTMIDENRDISASLDTNLTKSCVKLIYVVGNEKIPSYLN